MYNWFILMRLHPLLILITLVARVPSINLPKFLSLQMFEHLNNDSLPKLKEFIPPRSSHVPGIKSSRDVRWEERIRTWGLTDPIVYPARIAMKIQDRQEVENVAYTVSRPARKRPRTFLLVLPCKDLENWRCKVIAAVRRSEKLDPTYMGVCKVRGY